MSPFRASLRYLAISAAVTATLLQPALAAVVILEATSPPPITAAPPLITPAPETVIPQSLPPEPPPRFQNPPAPPNDSAILSPSPPATSPPQPTIAPAAPALAAPSPPIAPSDLGKVKVANPAEVTIEMMPGEVVSVGSRVSFRITSKQSGYLVLVDIDPTGHLTQIYPNTASLVRSNKPNGNFIRPGGKLTLPFAADPYGAVEYVVSPPNGQAMIIAILSAQPVQILDLPDVPATAKSQSDALAYLAKWTSELRIPDDATGQLREARWSFNAKSYEIR